MNSQHDDKDRQIARLEREVHNLTERLQEQEETAQEHQLMHELVKRAKAEAQRRERESVHGTQIILAAISIVSAIVVAFLGFGNNPIAIVIIIAITISVAALMLWSHW